MDILNIKLYVIAIISSFLSGMGIGGGSLLIMLLSLFNMYTQKEAQAINLFMFIFAGVGSTIFNIKNKKIDKKVFIQGIFSLLFGAIVGIMLVERISNDKLRIYFLIFMAIIGIYEIISSLKNMKSANNNNKSN